LQIYIFFMISLYSWECTLIGGNFMRTLLVAGVCIVGAIAFSGCAGSGLMTNISPRSTLNTQLSLQQKNKKLPEFNEPGNILIADQFNNRVIEIDPPSHALVWQFGNGSNVPGPDSTVGVNDAERVGSFTLIAGTGAPSGTEPGCGGAQGCPDNRVMLVNRQGQTVWQYGTGGVTGAGPNQLNTPVHSLMLPNKHVLITDQGNQRIIEVNSWRTVISSSPTRTTTASLRSRNPRKRSSGSIPPNRTQHS
jgi:hypothetical protein